MMDKTTMYGTVPTSSSAPVGYFARARETGRELYAQRRPWRELFDRHAFSKPENFQDAMGRIRRNLSYFRVNYALIILGIVFLSLLWHPISLIVFIIMFVAWGFLYFFRDEPLVVFGRTFSDGFVLCVLAVVTFVALILTHATLPFLMGLLIAVVIVMFHAAFKNPENYYVDEEESAAGGLLSVVDSAGPPSAPRV